MWLKKKLKPIKGFPDTGPGPGGYRTREQWLNAMGEDISLIQMYIRRSSDKQPSALDLALALKEARRLQSDIYRFGKEVYGISRDEIDKQGPL